MVTGTRIKYFPFFFCCPFFSPFFFRPGSPPSACCGGVHSYQVRSMSLRSDRLLATSCHHPLAPVAVVHMCVYISLPSAMYVAGDQTRDQVAVFRLKKIRPGRPMTRNLPKSTNQTFHIQASIEQPTVKIAILCILNPFRTPVPFWGHSTQIPSHLFSIVPKTRLRS